MDILMNTAAVAQLKNKTDNSRNLLEITFKGKLIPLILKEEKEDGVRMFNQYNPTETFFFPKGEKVSDAAIQYKTFDPLKSYSDTCPLCGSKHIEKDVVALCDNYEVEPVICSCCSAEWDLVLTERVNPCKTIIVDHGNIEA